MHRPIYIDEITIEGNLNLDIPTTLKKLKDKGLVAHHEDGAIIGVYPVSALRTRHKIQLADGRNFYAMCAIDALGAAYEFNQDLSVSSSCKRCDKNISMEAVNGDFLAVNPPTIHALHVDIEKYKDWAAAC